MRQMSVLIAVALAVSASTEASARRWHGARFHGAACLSPRPRLCRPRRAADLQRRGRLLLALVPRGQGVGDDVVVLRGGSLPTSKTRAPGRSAPGLD